MGNIKILVFFCILSNLCFGQYSISGIVTDRGGEALIGANVLLKGTSIGTVTDLDGTFRLEIPNDQKKPALIVSFIGYTSSEVMASVGDQITIVIYENDLLYCPVFSPGKIISFGPSYDLINQFTGIHVRHQTFLNKLGVGIISDVQLIFGNNDRFTVSSSNELTRLVHVENSTYLNLSFDYDYIKAEVLKDDIVESINMRRFILIPRFMGNDFKFGIGYLNQKEVNNFSNSRSGLAVDLEFMRIKSFAINLYGRVEFIEFGTQYILSARRTFRKLRSTLSIEYRKLHRFNALSFSATYDLYYF